MWGANLKELKHGGHIQKLLWDPLLGMWAHLQKSVRWTIFRNCVGLPLEIVICGAHLLEITMWPTFKNCGMWGAMFRNFGMWSLPQKLQRNTHLQNCVTWDWDPPGILVLGAYLLAITTWGPLLEIEVVGVSSEGSRILEF